MTISLGFMNLTIKSGAIIPLLVMLPNFLWMALPKGEGAAPGKSPPMWLNILENIGRAGILIIPFFYPLDFHKPYSLLVLVGMGVALGIYYACWLRYFTHGRKSELLRAPFMGIPLPLAVAPVVFLILSAYPLGSWLMLGVSILFGAAHIWVSKISL